MSYLYLNFVDNLDKGLGDKAWGKNDFFTQSLTDQYEMLKRKLGGYAPETLQELIGYIFPTTTKYFIIFPCRRLTERRRRISEAIRFYGISLFAPRQTCIQEVFYRVHMI